MARTDRLKAMLAGAASILDGLASFGGSFVPMRRSKRMQQVLRDLKLSDAERLRRDWDKVIQRTPPRKTSDKTRS